MSDIIDIRDHMAPGREEDEAVPVVNVVPDRVFTEPTGDTAVELLARVLATQSGLMRNPNSPEEFEGLPDTARHAMRELATEYAGIVREVDELVGTVEE